jgi:hypothetical protein
MKKLHGAVLFGGLLFASCTNPSADKQPATSPQDTVKTQDRFPQGSFGYDLNFLRQHDSVIVLNNKMASLIVSPKYQAKVFTSTADGQAGRSFGWINYRAFTAPVDAHMNAYGGEDRIWLGPEGGKFSLFFGKGTKMEFQNWHTPAPFDTASWIVTYQDWQSVSLRKDMQLVNYAGTTLSLSVERTIAMLDGHVIDTLLHLSPDTSVRGVGYRTVNILTNMGNEPWTATTGMPCLWMLDMFRPSPSATIIVPYKKDRNDKEGGSGNKIATTDYFGQIPAERIRYEKEGVLLFRADGKSRGKLGLDPTRARSMAGSYDAQNHLLTIILFDVDPSGKYLNQEWNTIKPSFSGDAVNAYNDGPLADGSQMGPFYELESVSPAAFLAPGQKLSHLHTVFHFTGDESALDRISRQTLGISLDEIKKAF